MSVHEMWGRLSPEEQRQALGSDNLYFASRALGHSPTSEEAIAHYYHNTGQFGIPGLHPLIHTFVVVDAPTERPITLPASIPQAA